MKEKEQKYRPFMVVYDRHRCISWMTREEMEEKLIQGEINSLRGQDTLDPFELGVYRAKLVIEKIQHEDEEYVAGNKEIADYLSQFSEEPISRNAAARARRRIAHKMGYKGGW